MLQQLEYMEVFYQDLPVLVVLTNHSLTLDIQPEDIITLTAFTPTHVHEYLSKIVGHSQIPQEIIQRIYAATQGNPLYVTEYVRHLLQKGFFKDQHGSWSQEILEDLSHEFKSIGAEIFIKKGLAAHLAALKLSDIHYDLLFNLALTGKPTIADMMELSDPMRLEHALVDLVEKGIIKAAPTKNYVC